MNVTTWRRRFGSALERFAGQGTAALPAPPEIALLHSAREQLATSIADERAGEIERIKQRLSNATSQTKNASVTELADARGELSRLAESLIAELRQRLPKQLAREGNKTLAAIALRADQSLATNEKEYLDLPDFDEGRRTEALRALDRFNRSFGSYHRFAAALAPLLPLSIDTAPITILDIASGHGGFAIALAQLFGAQGRRARIIASDLRPEYLAIGRKEAAALGLSGHSSVHIEFSVVDALRISDQFAPGEIDVITCTQSLHHFGAGGTATLLAEAVRHARRGVLFVDLLRAPSATLAAVGLGLLSANRTVFHDALLSFRKAFVPEELALIAACVPGGETLEALFLAPAFTALRTL